MAENGRICHAGSRCAHADRSVDENGPGGRGQALRARGGPGACLCSAEASLVSGLAFAERSLLVQSRMSSRSPVPRPGPRTKLPTARHLQNLEIHLRYASAPPLIREREPTLNLEDDDLIENETTAVMSRSEMVSAPSSCAPSTADGWDRSGEGDTRSWRTSAAFGILAHAFEYERTCWHAAKVCAQVLARDLRARAVVVYLYDPNAHELRAIGVCGEGTADLLGASHAVDDDFVATAAISNRKPTTVQFDGGLPHHAPAWLRHLPRAPKTLVAVPINELGRRIGLVEVLDPAVPLRNEAAPNGPRKTVDARTSALPLQMRA